MHQKQRETWERTRAKGKWRFVLLIAAYFCIVMTLTFSVYDYFFGFYGFRFERLYFLLPFNLVIGLITGLIFWFFAENKYRKSSGNL
jgi:hypothetical protein